MCRDAERIPLPGRAKSGVTAGIYTVGNELISANKIQKTFTIFQNKKKAPTLRGSELNSFDALIRGAEHSQTIR
jgi:hypothetical protein